jgi:hypothetical protein
MECGFEASVWLWPGALLARWPAPEVLPDQPRHAPRLARQGRSSDYGRVCEGGERCVRAAAGDGEHRVVRPRIMRTGSPATSPTCLIFEALQEAAGEGSSVATTILISSSPPLSSLQYLSLFSLSPGRSFSLSAGLAGRSWRGDGAGVHSSSSRVWYA